MLHNQIGYLHLDIIRVYRQQSDRFLDQLFLWQTGVPSHHSLRQGIYHTAADTIFRIDEDAGSKCDLIRRFKTDTVNLFRNAVRIGLKHIINGIAIIFIDLDRQLIRHAIIL